MSGCGCGCVGKCVCMCVHDVFCYALFTYPPPYSQLIKDYDEIRVQVLLARPNCEYESVLIHKTVSDKTASKQLCVTCKNRNSNRNCCMIGVKIKGKSVHSQRILHTFFN